MMPSLKKRSHKGYERVATDDLDEIAESYGPEDVPVPKVLHDFDPNVRPAPQSQPPAPAPSVPPRARPANGGAIERGSHGAAPQMAKRLRRRDLVKKVRRARWVASAHLRAPHQSAAYRCGPSARRRCGWAGASGC